MFTLAPGRATSSMALACAFASGFPDEILTRASEVMGCFVQGEKIPPIKDIGVYIGSDLATYSHHKDEAKKEVERYILSLLSCENENKDDWTDEELLSLLEKLANFNEVLVLQEEGEEAEEEVVVAEEEVVEEEVVVVVESEADGRQMASPTGKQERCNDAGSEQHQDFQRERRQDREELQHQTHQQEQSDDYTHDVHRERESHTSDSEYPSTTKAPKALSSTEKDLPLLHVLPRMHQQHELEINAQHPWLRKFPASGKHLQFADEDDDDDDDDYVLNY